MDYPRAQNEGGFGPNPTGVRAMTPAGASPNPSSGINIPEPPAMPVRKQPIAQLRIAITALHEAILLEPEAEDKAVMATCLTNLIKLQAKNQKEQSGGAAGAR